MIYADSDSYFKIWDIDKRENETIVQMGTSRKDKRTDEYVNSTWSYTHFVGKANEKVRELNKGDRITNVRLGLSWEPYEKDGKKVYAKSPRMVVFDFEVAYAGKKKDVDEINEPDDSELPF